MDLEKLQIANTINRDISMIEIKIQQLQNFIDVVTNIKEQVLVNEFRIDGIIFDDFHNKIKKYSISLLNDMIKSENKKRDLLIKQFNQL